MDDSVPNARELAKRVSDHIIGDHLLGRSTKFSVMSESALIKMLSGIIDETVYDKYKRDMRGHGERVIFIVEKLEGIIFEGKFGGNPRKWSAQAGQNPSQEQARAALIDAFDEAAAAWAESAARRGYAAKQQRMAQSAAAEVSRFVVRA